MKSNTKQDDAPAPAAAPVQEPPPAEAPVQEPPPAEAPVQEAPAVEAPVQEAPVEAPVQEEPAVEEAPQMEAEEKPVVEKKKKKKSQKLKKTTIRYPSSYLLFTMEYRKVVKQENPTMTLGDISKKCGAEWQQLPEEEKLKWKTTAETEKLRRKSLEVDTGEEKVIKKKRVPSSYLLFSMKERANIMLENPTLKIGECSKLCGEKWKLLTVTEKDVWTQKSNDMKSEMNKV